MYSLSRRCGEQSRMPTEGIFVIMPAYNAGHTIERVFARFPRRWTSAYRVMSW